MNGKHEAAIHDTVYDCCFDLQTTLHQLRVIRTGRPAGVDTGADHREVWAAQDSGTLPALVKRLATEIAKEAELLK